MPPLPHDVGFGKNSPLLSAPTQGGLGMDNGIGAVGG